MRALLAPLPLIVVLGCGARTGLEVLSDDERFDVGARDGGALDAPTGCRTDGECDDGVECTLDRCTATECLHDPIDTRCADDRFCTIAERCDVARGCVSDTVACDDGRTCTADTCDDGLASCRFTAIAACPILAHDSTRIFELDVTAGEPTFRTDLMPAMPPLTDIAYAPDGTLYGVTWPAFGTIDLASGRFTPLVRSSIGDMTALVVTDDGTFYVGSSEGIFLLDPVSGMTTLVEGRAPGALAVGDLEIVDGRVFATVTLSASGMTPDLLVELLPDGGVRVAGSLGVPCMWALAVVDGRLHGISCDTNLYAIDPETAATTLLRNVGFAGWGASAQR